MCDKQDNAGIEALARLLDTHGADRTRWPAALRLRLAPLIASNGEARRLIREALAFDRLLDMAPRLSSERERAAVERIVARAKGETQRPAPVPLRRPPHAHLRTNPAWSAAALLAASLVVGVFTGFAMSSGRDGEIDLRQAVLDERTSVLADEELL